MREILNLGLRLLIITLVAALALAVTNSITEGPIREAEFAANNAARLKVMPGADAFEPVEPQADTPDLQEAYHALKDGETVGYTFKLSPNGYKGAIPVTVGILADGTLTSIDIGANSETAGLGTKVQEPEFKDQFTGIAADRVAHDVNTISGATISSRACVNAVKQAVEAYEWLIKEGAQ